ncbi:MAG: YceI family protein [Bacteroidia bacterium]|nr:YceI family protein [Bacteroidia bacterium]
MKKTVLLFFFANAFLHAQQLRVDTSKSFISYEASHPVHDWSGTSEEVQGVVVVEDNVPSRIAIVASVASFNSKNSNRDAHAVEVLEALLFPQVSFYSDAITFDDKELKLSGELNFHGVPLPLDVSSYWTSNEDHWVLEGNFEIQPSLFGIKLPSFMLVKMRDLLSVRFRLELRTFVP